MFDIFASARGVRAPPPTGANRSAQGPVPVNHAGELFRQAVWNTTDGTRKAGHIRQVLCVGAKYVGSYRIYRVGHGGRLQLGEAFEAPDDAHAVEQARTHHATGEAAELWKGGRLVGRFSKIGTFTPGTDAG